MKAKQLLTNVMEAENNTSTKVENLIKKNVKFLGDCQKKPHLVLY